MKTYLVKIYLTLLATVFSIQAATYYVDFDAGNDANNGTATNTAWRTIPGTRNLTNDAYRQAAWGSITTSAKVPTNSIIYFKQGTTYSTADTASAIVINSDYYTDNSASRDAFIFQPLTNWGTGLVTLDATGMNLGVNGVEGFIAISLDGVSFKGVNTNLWIVNSPRSGIHVKEKSGTSFHVTNLVFTQLILSNNCTSYLTDGTAAGDAQLNIRKGQAPWIFNNLIKGGPATNFANGILLGDSGSRQVFSFGVSNNLIESLRGDTSNNDAGIGIKILNSDGVIFNNIVRNSLKGIDAGEFNADSSYSSDLIIHNNITISNYWGINFNWSGLGSATNKIRARVFNNLVVSNQWNGMNIYAAPLEPIIVNNTFAYNGDANQSGTYSGHIRYSFDTDNDTNAFGIRSILKNNVFFRAYDAPINLTRYNPTNQYLVMDHDYNLYVQSTNAAEVFNNWGYFNTGTDLNFAVSWGSPWSPGSTNGQWYTHYTKFTNTPPAGGTGHWHADANSKLILNGEEENSPSVFWSDTTNYVNRYKRNGLNYSGESWYDSRMGFDKNGSLRVFWSIGAYDGAPSSWSPPPSYLFSNTTNIVIPTIVGTATPYPSIINVSGLTLSQITNVTVTLTNFGHQFNRDVDILLTGPGTTNGVVLMSDSGNGSPFFSVNLTFNDLATASLPGTGANVTSGTYLPTEIAPSEIFTAPAPQGSYVTTLRNVWTNGVNGAWSLYVLDDGNTDGGSITNGWYIQFYYINTNAAPVPQFSTQGKFNSF